VASGNGHDGKSRSGHRLLLLERFRACGARPGGRALLGLLFPATAGEREQPVFAYVLPGK
jgi:hypothetical protein